MFPVYSGIVSGQTITLPASKPAVRFSMRRFFGFAWLMIISSCLYTLDLGHALASETRSRTVASWYGEAHRGKLMANGKKFDPDRMTAASWFYSLGTKVRVTSDSNRRRSVVVTITDRGPAWDLVRGGRLIDLSHAAFRHLAAPNAGLVGVQLEPVKPAAR
jgi:rare lipoprotein A